MNAERLLNVLIEPVVSEKELTGRRAGSAVCIQGGPGRGQKRGATGGRETVRRRRRGRPRNERKREGQALR